MCVCLLEGITLKWLAKAFGKLKLKLGGTGLSQYS